MLFRPPPVFGDRMGMGAQIINFPLTANQAWEAYQRLVRECTADPRLIDDPDHREAVSRAFATFYRIYTEAA